MRKMRKISLYVMREIICFFTFTLEKGMEKDGDEVYVIQQSDMTSTWQV